LSPVSGRRLSRTWTASGGSGTTTSRPPLRNWPGMVHVAAPGSGRDPASASRASRPTAARAAAGFGRQQRLPATPRPGSSRGQRFLDRRGPLAALLLPRPAEPIARVDLDELLATGPPTHGADELEHAVRHHRTVLLGEALEQLPEIAAA
jgi:hypothetical protein